MQVTEVKLSLRDHEMVRAYVDITLDDCIIIYGLRLFGTITVIWLPFRNRGGGRAVTTPLSVGQPLKRAA